MEGSVIPVSPAGESMATRSQICFWLGFWILFSKFFIQAIPLFDADEIFLRLLLFFGAFFLILRVCILFVDNRVGSLAFLGVCFGGICYVTAGESVLLTTALIIAAAYGIDIQKIFRLWSRAVAVILLFMLWGHFVALALGFEAGQTWSNIGGLSSDRGALFFVHPNYCAAVCFAWAVTVWCREDVGRMTKLIFGMVSMSIIFFIAGSRTSALSLGLFFILASLFDLWKKSRSASFERLSSRFILLVPLLLIVFTFWISSIWFMGSSFSQAVSDMLTGRPALWWAQWRYAGLTLLGHHAFEGILLIRGSYHDIHTVDGVYASFLYNIGLCGFAWLIALIKRAAIDLGKLSPTCVAALISIFVFGFAEWHAVNVIVCLPLIFLSFGMKPDRKKRRGESL